MKMSTKQLIFNNKEIRIIPKENKLYFCGKDIGNVLGYKNIKYSLQSIDSQFKISLSELQNDLSHNDGRAVYLNEQGLDVFFKRCSKSNGKELNKYITEFLIENFGRENPKQEIVHFDSDFMKFIQNTKLALDFQQPWFRDLWYPLNRAKMPWLYNDSIQIPLENENIDNNDISKNSVELQSTSNDNTHNFNEENTSLSKHMLQHVLEKPTSVLDNTNLHEKNTGLSKQTLKGVLEQKIVLDNKIIITETILKWLGYEGRDYSHKRQTFIKLLKNKNIQFSEIKYDQEIIDNYEPLKLELENTDKKYHKQKYWIIMNIEDFQKSVMRLDTKNAENIRDYYLNIEKVMFAYVDYIKQQKEIKNKQKIIYENQQMKENLEIEKQQRIEAEHRETEIQKQLIESDNRAIKAERRELRLKEKIVEFQKKEQTQIVYISTSKSYAAQNRFKVGGTESVNTAKNRLNQYNTRSAEGDEWYYAKIHKVSNYRAFENRFWDIMNKFRDTKDKEMIVMRYDDLEHGFDFIVENYHEDVEYFNNNLKLFIDKTYIDFVEPIIPDKLNTTFVQTVTIQEGQISKITLENTELLTKLNEIIEQMTEHKLYRTQIFDLLKDYKFDKRHAWKLLKNIKNKQIFYK